MSRDEYGYMVIREMLNQWVEIIVIYEMLNEWVGMISL
jgi:hypothetical protein